MSRVGGAALLAIGVACWFARDDRGSRAQHDLVTFTLLKAYLEAGRLDDARRLLGTRRQGSSSVPIAGSEAVH